MTFNGPEDVQNRNAQPQRRAQMILNCHLLEVSLRLTGSRYDPGIDPTMSLRCHYG